MEKESVLLFQRLNKKVMKKNIVLALLAFSTAIYAEQTEYQNSQPVFVDQSVPQTYAPQPVEVQVAPNQGVAQPVYVQMVDPQTGNVVYVQQMNQPVAYVAPAPVAAYSQSPEQPVVPPKKKSRGLYNSGFFMDLSMGVAIDFMEEDFEQKVYDYDSDRSGKYSAKVAYDGVGPFFSSKFGGIIHGLFSIYSLFELSFSRGDMDYSSSYTYSDECFDCEMNNALGFRVMFGAGLGVYPVRDSSSAFNGIFFNAAVGVVGVVAGGGSSCGFYYDDVDDEISASGMGLKIELGKVWQIADRWFAGVSAAFNIDFVDEEEDYDYYDSYRSSRNFNTPDFSSHSIWLGVKFLRK